MILRLSQKLAKKLKEAPSKSLPLDINPFADWSAHLFTAERTQFIILTNTPSLYSTVMYGRGITCESEFIEMALNCISEYTLLDGQASIYRRFVAPATAEVAFSKPLSRAVTGSMNKLVSAAKMWLVEVGLPPYDASFRINSLPMSCHNYRNPREAFMALRVEESVSGKSR